MIWSSTCSCTVAFEIGTEHLDAAVEIARHHVGRGDVDRGLAVRQAVTAAEAVDAAVLEEAADDRLDADAFRQAGHARPQAADAAHHEVDLDARARGFIERVDDLRIDQRIHLHPDRGGTAGLGVRDLVGDVIEDALLQVERRDRHLFQLGGSA
jgi:hypothetical protein